MAAKEAGAAVSTGSAEYRTPGLGVDATKTNRVYRIVLTGGPCAGKTTALARMSERLTDFGFCVLRVPEAATLLQSGGLTFAGLRQEQVVDMQAHLMRVQAALEDEFDGIARSMNRFSNRPSVLICDRGLMDGRAYVSSAMFREVVLVSRVDPRVEKAVEAALPALVHDTAPAAADDTSIQVRRSSSDTQLHSTGAAAAGSSGATTRGSAATAVDGVDAKTALGLPSAAASLLPSLTPHAGPVAAQRLQYRSHLMRDRDVAAAVAEAVARMRDERYDAVLHLVTAADGAEKYYTLQNNATRTETVEQAIAVDCAIREAWLGSPAHRIVGNTLSAGFEDKMDRCIGALSRQLGLPRPGAVKRFWVLRCSSIDEWTAAPSLVVRDFAVVHTYLHDSAGKWTAAPPPAPAAGTAAAAASGGAADSSGKHITNSVRLTLRRALDLDIDEDAVDVAAASTATSPRSPAPVDVDDSGIPLGRDGVPLTMVASGLNSGEITLQLRAARKAASSTARPIAESQRMLKPREYASLLSSRNPKARVVAKRRRVFVHASRSFELDEITAPPAYRGLCLLSAEANDEEEDVALPTGIEQASEDGHVPSGSIQAVEVTGDSRFLTSSLARAQGPPTSEWGRPDDAPTSRA